MKKKIGVFSDTHGNYFALKAILELFEKEKVDEIIHCGDIVDIGPNSKECLLLLLQQKNCTLLLGNHDRDYLNKHCEHVPFSHVSSEHKQFVFNSIGDELRTEVKKFPLVTYRTAGNQLIAFCHYAFQETRTPCDHIFKPIEHNPTAEKLDELFEHFHTDAVFFGHKHEPCDIKGKRMYVDVGSLGCHKTPFARGIVLEIDDDGWTYRRVETPYDRNAVLTEMLKTQLPDAGFIFEFYFDLQTGNK